MFKMITNMKNMHRLLVNTNLESYPDIDSQD